MGVTNNPHLEVACMAHSMGMVLFLMILPIALITPITMTMYIAKHK